MDDDMQAVDPGGIELERRLDAFARARLGPDPQATARIRARVMREARLHGEAARIAVHIAPAIATQRRSPARRLIMPFVAATAWLAIGVGSIAAAQAGGPLYPTRLWIETATLPAVGGPRIEADLQRLDTRVGEVLSAATRGDMGAVAAALDAYAGVAQDATASSAADAALQARVEEALSHHQAVLAAVATNLAAKGNDTAANAIERNLQRAIDQNAAVILTLKNAKANGPGNANGNGAGGNGNANGNGAGGNGNANGNGAGGNGNANGNGAGGPPVIATPPGAGNGNPGVNGEPGAGNGNPGGNGPGVATSGPASEPSVDPDRTHKPKSTPGANGH
jgi:hypothetical protein